MGKSRGKIFADLNQKKLNSALGVFVAICVSLAGLLYWVAGNRAQASLAEQTLHREQVITRAGVRSIESFIELLGAQVTTLSAREAMTSGDLGKSEAAMDLFMKKWMGTPVAGIILAGEDGKVLVNANRAKSVDVGKDVSDRDYFAWAKDARQSAVFVSKSFVSRMGASKGQYVVVVASPVVENGEFRGVLAAGVVLSEVTETYLTPLKISDRTQVYLVNHEGIFLSSAEGALVGQSFITYIKDNPFPGSDILVENLEKQLASAFELGEGKLNYLRNSPEDKNSIKRWLLAYSTIDFGGKDLEQPEDTSSQRWILAVETPAEDAFAFFGPFQVNQAATFIFIIAVILGISAIGVLTTRIAQRDSYLRGFAEGRDHTKAENHKQG